MCKVVWYCWSYRINCGCNFLFYGAEMTTLTTEQVQELIERLQKFQSAAAQCWAHEAADALSQLLADNTAMTLEKQMRKRVETKNIELMAECASLRDRVKELEAEIAHIREGDVAIVQMVDEGKAREVRLEDNWWEAVKERDALAEQVVQMREQIQCVQTNLFKGMSASIQKLQARELRETLALSTQTAEEILREHDARVIAKTATLIARHFELKPHKEMFGASIADEIYALLPAAPEVTK